MQVRSDMQFRREKKNDDENIPARCDLLFFAFFFILWQGEMQSGFDEYHAIIKREKDTLLDAEKLDKKYV